MSQQRYDVVVRALNGPLASMGEQKFQGPLVRIGSNPGPGGMVLTGYRGIDARQCVITAYGEGEATVGPVGTNQVRMAPHPNVNWKDIDPLRQPEYLNKGCAIHLGPVGRGCTLEFVRVEKLGVWTGGRVGSASQDVASEKISAPIAAAKKATGSRGAARIRAAGLGVGVVGCLGILVASVAGVMVVGGLWQGGFFDPEIKKLGPVEDGEEFYDAVSLKDLKEIDKQVLSGLNEGFRVFVAEPSAEQARKAGRTDTEVITDPATWDQKTFEYVAVSMATHAKARYFYRRIEAIKDDYAFVTRELRRAQLPEVLAAMPYAESRYRPTMQSWACAKGYWQFMPEVANRIEKKHGLSFQVADCALPIRGEVINWTPRDLAPPINVAKNAIYVSKDQNIDRFAPERCLIKKENGCRVDDRTDLQKSTSAAIVALKEAWDNDVLAKSGSGVTTMISSHNCGLDDSRFRPNGAVNRSNVLPAFERWAANHSPSEYHRFYGDNIKCPTRKTVDSNRCGSALPIETQHYAYSIIAEHLVAVCYYAQNYGDQYPEFAEWERFIGDDGYCSGFAIPSADEVRSW